MAWGPVCLQQALLVPLAASGEVAFALAALLPGGNRVACVF